MNQKDVAEETACIPRIEFRNVSICYDDEVVLDDVSFVVWPAELKLMLGECAQLTAEGRAGQCDHFDIERAAAHLHGMLESMNRATRSANAK